MTLRVGIYIEPVKVSAKTGISRHIIGLVEALVNLNHDTHYYLYYQADLLGQTHLNWLNTQQNVTHRGLRFPKNWLSERPSLWWKHYLPFHLWKDKIDVFHGANHAIPLRGKCPKVVTIHDLAYYYMEVHGEGFDRYLQHTTNLAMAVANKVIAVSQSTANDCIREGVPANKIEMIYQGFEGVPEALHIEPKPAMSSQPYILFIGTIQPRKNIEYIIKAFKQISAHYPHQLILAGAPGDSSENAEKLITELGLNDRVTLLGYISDEERDNLYRHADVFVYPSKYEGFGLVLLEAMSYNLPVITADNSALPEAAGDAALYCDAEKPETLAQALRVLFSQPETRNTLIANSQQQIAKFTWQTCAEHTSRVYQSLAKQEHVK